MLEEPQQETRNTQAPRKSEISFGDMGIFPHLDRPAREDAALPGPLRQKMERAFNTDFSRARVHPNTPDASSISALAFTQGRDIHFAPGQYNPASPAGQRIIAHELAHVVQQQQGRVAMPQSPGVPVNADPDLEAEADALGNQAVQSELVTTSITQKSNAAEERGTGPVNSPVQRVTLADLRRNPTAGAAMRARELEEEEEAAEAQARDRSLAERIAYDPEAGSVLQSTLAGSLEGEGPGLGKKITKGFSKARAQVSGAIAGLRETGEGSLVRGAWRTGKARAAEGLQQARDFVGQQREQFASFREKVGQQEGAVAKARTVAGGVGRLATRLATGMSTEQISQRWQQSKGIGGKLKTGAQIGGRVINRLGFGVPGKIAKGVSKLGTGIGGLVESLRARGKAAESQDELVRTAGTGLAKSQAVESGFQVGTGAATLTSGILSATPAPPIASTLTGLGGTAINQVGKLVTGEGAGSSVDYLSRGVPSHLKELQRSMGWSERSEAVRRKQEASRTGSGKEAYRLESEAARLKEMGRQRAEDIQEGRSTVRPSQVKAQALSEIARRELSNRMQGQGVLAGLQRAQDWIDVGSGRVGEPRADDEERRR